MDPVLLDTVVAGRQVTVASYDAFLFLAALAVVGLGWVGLRRLGLPIRAGVAVVAVMIGAVLAGARALTLVAKPTYYAEHPEMVWTTETVGFSLMGGLLLAALVGFVGCRVARIDAWRLADALAPGLFVGLAVMRLGCFLAGCCFGAESSLPWAVQFPYGSPAQLFYSAETEANTFSLFTVVEAPTVHPTQLYELVGSLVACGVAVALLRRRAAVGVPFLSACLVFLFVRLGNHMLRAESPTDELPYLAYPVLYLVLIVVVAVLLRARLVASTDGAPAATVTTVRAVG